jgi:hypothetical protein
MSIPISEESITKKTELEILDFTITLPKNGKPYYATVVWGEVTRNADTGDLINDPKPSETRTFTAPEIASGLPNSKLPGIADVYGGLSELFYTLRSAQIVAADESSSSSSEGE